MKRFPVGTVALLTAALIAGGAGGYVAARMTSTPAVQPTGFQGAYLRVRGAIVTVKTDLARLDSLQSAGIGTAFHIGGGYYVTCAHVIEGAQVITLNGPGLSGGRDVTATLQGRDDDRDLAVLKADPAASTLAWAASPPATGDPVAAIGNPFGSAPGSLSAGIVGGRERIADGDNRSIAGLLQSDTAMNPGNSGGPLVDSAGQVVGVNDAILSPTGAFAGIGLSIPAAQAQPVVDALRGGRKVSHPHLGISAADADPDVVARVLPGSLAEKVGLQLGDSIQAVGGVPVTSIRQAEAVAVTHASGDELALSVTRASKPRTLNLTLP